MEKIILRFKRPKRLIQSLVLAGTFLLNVPLFGQESSPTDEIVVKATNVVIFQMTSNLKLTQDQVNAIQPIVADNIAKTRNLQQSLEDGNIDSKAMYDQRQQLIVDEDQQLSAILTPAQLRLWESIQNQPYNSQTSHVISK